MKAKPTKRIRRSPEAARQAIVKSAVECFACDGFHDTSFQKIADLCGMSQTAVLYHFKTKADLLRGVLESILVHNGEVVGKFLADESSPKSKIHAHFEGNLQWALQYRDEAKIILLLYYYASQFPEFTKLYRAIRRNAVIKLRRFVPENLAPVAHDVLLGSIVNCLSQGAGPNSQAACRKSWKSFFHLL